MEMERVMAGEKVHLRKEKETLLITLYGKALDSREEDSVLHDRLADELVRKIDYDFEKVKLRRDQWLGLAMRARILDRWTTEFIKENPGATVLNLGCGLDSRVFRVDPPPSIAWFDVDYPEVVELRRRLLPQRQGYRMIGASVTEPHWLNDVPGDRPVMILAEGLFPYLKEYDGIEMLRRLMNHFPRGELAFDGYNRFGVRLIQSAPPIKATGATLHWAIGDPKELEKLVPRLRFAGEFTSYNPEQIARFSLLTRLVLVLWKLIPVLRRAGQLLRYRF